MVDSEAENAVRDLSVNATTAALMNNKRWDGCTAMGPFAVSRNWILAIWAESVASPEETSVGTWTVPGFCIFSYDATSSLWYAVNAWNWRFGLESGHYTEFHPPSFERIP